MKNPTASEEPKAPSPGLTRRNVLGCAAALAVTPLFAGQARAAQTSRRAVRRTTVKRASAYGVGAGRPRYLHASVGLPDGRVVVIGGYGVSEATRSRAASAPMRSVQAYDPRTDAWTDLAPMRVPRARHAAVALPDGRIVVLGGYYTGPVSSVEIYDPWSDVWSACAPLSRPMVDHAVSVCAAGLLVTGGQNGTPGLLLPIPG